MGRSSRKRQQQSRPRRIEALISTQREDGLWQSIEKDEEELASNLANRAITFADETSLVGKEDRTANQGVDHNHQEPQDIDTSKLAQKRSRTLSFQDVKPIKTETPPPSRRPTTPTRTDLLARVLNCPFPHQGLPTPVHPVPDLPVDAPQDPATPCSGTKRRRGRPRKSRSAPNWNKRRRVRFSDPIPPDQDPQPGHQDTHVFVRLLKIIVTVGDPHPPQRQELAWNNRAKGWRLAGERSERNIADVAELFDDLSAHGSILSVVLAPTVGRGAREAVEMGWNAARFCFQGVNQDIGPVSVALGEMKDMVKDPWARQFVGNVLV